MFLRLSGIKKGGLRAQQEHSIQFTGLSHTAQGAACGMLPWWSAPAAHKLCRGNKRTGQTLLRCSPCSISHSAPPSLFWTKVQRASNPPACQSQTEIPSLHICAVLKPHPLCVCASILARHRTVLHAYKCTTNPDVSGCDISKVTKHSLTVSLRADGAAENKRFECWTRFQFSTVMW